MGANRDVRDQLAADRLAEKAVELFEIFLIGRPVGAVRKSKSQ